jgi:hypothetical protein
LYGIDKLVDSLGIKKQEGTSVFQSILTLIYLSVIGKKRVSKGELLKDYGIAAIAGISKILSKSYLHEFLDQITVSCAEKFQIVSAKAFGIFKGKIINLDGHFIAYFGKCKIGKDKHTTRNISMPGIKSFISHDQTKSLYYMRIITIYRGDNYQEGILIRSNVTATWQFKNVMELTKYVRIYKKDFSNALALEHIRGFLPCSIYILGSQFIQ